MRKFRYDPKVKQAFLAAAVELLSQGKGWDEAHAKAKSLGYNGSKDGLDVMIRKEKASGKLKQIIAAASKPAEKAAPAPAGGVEDLNVIINNIVAQRVTTVLSKVKKVIDEAIAE